MTAIENPAIGESFAFQHLLAPEPRNVVMYSSYIAFPTAVDMNFSLLTLTQEEVPSWREAPDLTTYVWGSELSVCLEKSSEEQQQRFTVHEIETKHITYLKELDDDQYELLRPVPVSVDRDPEGGWAACIEGSTIAMPGDSREQAIDELIGAMLDIYDVYSGDDPDSLGPGPAREWSVLKQYLRHRQ